MFAMEVLPTFPSNKRHAMHFRQQLPTDNFITATFPNPKLDYLSPSNVSIATCRTPESIEEALALSRSSRQLMTHEFGKVKPIRQPLPRSQSSSWWMEIRKSPGRKQVPRSKKTDEATIRTEATTTQPAFESDAFAVHMPATREPILNPPIYRAKLPAPSKAQVEAYHTYKQKAEEVREKQTQEGVRVPSEIISYDCAYGNTATRALMHEVNRSPSPARASPAGAFPASPPLQQNEWKTAPSYPPDKLSASDSCHIPIARRAVTIGSSKPNVSKSRAQIRNIDTGASHSLPRPSPAPSVIRVRVKPQGQTSDRPQKESSWGLYHQSPASSADGSRSPSPTKSNADIVYTSPTNTGIDDDGILVARNVPPTSKASPVKIPKAKTASRWAWLRPAGPRTSKPAAAVTANPAKTTSYVDPFVIHATPISTHPGTPIASRSPSPRKSVRLHNHSPSTAEQCKFDTGFAQVKYVTSLILKLCLIIYLLVGMYFVLDALRQVVHVMGTPFRLVKLVGMYLWIGGASMANAIARGWERWGVKIALRGGWRGRWW